MAKWKTCRFSLELSRFGAVREVNIGHNWITNHQRISEVCDGEQLPSFVELFRPFDDIGRRRQRAAGENEINNQLKWSRVCLLCGDLRTPKGLSVVLQLCDSERAKARGYSGWLTQPCAAGGIEGWHNLSGIRSAVRRLSHLWQSAHELLWRASPRKPLAIVEMRLFSTGP